MRLAPALLGLTAFVFAQTAMSQAAWAAPVTLAPVAVSAELQIALDEELGAREGDVLRRNVAEAVAAALARHGVTVSSGAPETVEITILDADPNRTVSSGAPVTVEITILDADPNRPTFQQMSDTPGLDGFRSISIGGAQLRGTLRGADGQVLREVTHRRYNHSLADVTGAATTWTEARNAIRQFAEKIADAYVAAEN